MLISTVQQSDSDTYTYIYIYMYIYICMGYWGVSVVKNLLANAGVWSLGWEDPLEEEMSTHFSILAWKIPWTEKHVGYSPWGHRSDLTEHAHIHSFSHPFPLWFIIGYWIYILCYLCYTVGSCCLSVLYTRIWSTNPKLSIHPSPTPPRQTASLSSTSVSLFLFCR